MKKVLLSFIAGLFTLFITAQTPTLDSASYGLLIGESTMYYVADSNAANMSGTSGSGVTWDYSQLQGYGNTVADSVISPAATSYPTTFSSSYGCDSIESNYMNYYSYKTSDTLIIDGYVLKTSLGDVLAEMDQDKQIGMFFPFTYNTMFTDSFAGTAVLPTFGNATYDGQISVQGDGEGTLQLPNGVSYNNTLRVKVVENATAQATLATFNVVRTKYLYYVSGNKFPVLRHENIDISGPVSSTITSVLSRHPLLPMGVEESNAIAASVKLFPNPAADQATLRFTLNEAANVRATVNDLLGNEVNVLTNAKLNSGNHQLDVNTSGLSGGVYFVNIQTGNSSITRKLIVE